MNKWILRTVVALALVFYVAVPAAPAYAKATNPFPGICTTKEIKKSAVCQTPANGADPLTTTNGVIHKVTQLFAIIAGAVAVIVIAVGGVTYIGSHGDAEQIKKAKNAIIYALVGLVVILVGQAIINLVISKV